MFRFGNAFALLGIELRTSLSLGQMAALGYRCFYILLQNYHHHHQPINAPTAGAKAFLMKYTQVIGRDQRLNVPSKARRSLR
jgi:hypothetical protein